MLACPIERADELAGHADNPSAEAELEHLVNLIDVQRQRKIHLFNSRIAWL